MRKRGNKAEGVGFSLGHFELENKVQKSA